MSTSGASNQPIDTEISQLTSQILLLQKRRLELARRRNQSALIAQLPSELLAIVFSYCAHALGVDELRSITGSRSSNVAPVDAVRIQSAHDNLPFPDIMRISHVSHAWRELVLGDPHLWTRIEVQEDTSPKVVAFMNSLARSRPIELVYVGTSHYQAGFNLLFGGPKVLAELQKVVRQDFGNIRSITLFCDSAVAIHLLTAAVGEAWKLEVLVLSSPKGLCILTDIFKSKTPNLRRISLEGVILSWKLPVFISSPYLTHVHLGHGDVYRPERIADLRQFLRQSPRLENLCFTLPFCGRPNFDDLDLLLTSFDLSHDIPLPNLQVLSVHSRSSQATLSGVLFGLRIPEDISRLSLSVEMQRSSNAFASEQLHGIMCQMIACGRPPEDYVAPEELEIHPSWARCSYPHSKGGFGETKVSVLTPRVYGPSNGATAFQLPWSYKRLKSVTINLPSRAVPESFWPALAKLETLGKVVVSGEQPHAFLNSLRMGAPGDPDRPSYKSPNATVTNVPFPALRIIRFISVTEGLRWCVKKGKDPAVFRATRHFRTFFMAILWALKGRCGGALEELAFLGCGQWHQQAQDPNLHALFEVATVVHWEGVALKPESESSCGRISLLGDEEASEAAY